MKSYYDIYYNLLNAPFIVYLFEFIIILIYCLFIRIYYYFSLLFSNVFYIEKIKKI